MLARIRNLQRRFAAARASRSAAGGRALVVVVALAGWVVADALRAAEIQLRPTCRPATVILKLADVAEIHGSPDEQARLGSVELGPVATTGLRRAIHVRQIQDILASQGLNLLEHRFTGASQIELLKPQPPEPAPRDAWLAGGVKHRANETVAAAIVRRLGQEGESWLAQVEVDDATAQAISQANYVITVRPTGPIDEGRQRFEIELVGGVVRIAEAEIHRAAVVVVAQRPLAKGAVIQASDLRVQALSDDTIPRDAFRRLDEVLGREASKTIAAGVPLGRSNVRTPLLVHRGDVVTVVARSQGLRVQTNARAREEGSLGDVIAVESLLNRQSFFARVTGLQEVDVYARAIEARETPDAAPSLSTGLTGPGGRR